MPYLLIAATLKLYGVPPDSPVNVFVVKPPVTADGIKLPEP